MVGMFALAFEVGVYFLGDLALVVMSVAISLPLGGEVGEGSRCEIWSSAYLFPELRQFAEGLNVFQEVFP
jgi:hypothetical protein